MLSDVRHMVLHKILRITLTPPEKATYRRKSGDSCAVLQCCAGDHCGRMRCGQLRQYVVSLVRVVPLSFLAVLSYPRNVRGLPPRLLSPGCVGVVPLSFLAVLPYPILAMSGDCLLGCRALDV
ncbi:unnamed protein product [Nezara viridula]|uniref:Uncharacterized protein n=1 Tax=Nezara viridula TaxID=85310 RepID=A0A9P0MKA5_NEZVI|nr:unnamed protein product [Nezara viridula]